MTNKTFAIIFLLVSLLTQQVSAGVMNASMFGNMNSSISSEMSSGEMAMNMSHQHHQMGSQMDEGISQGDAMDMQNMDCCQSDCANCLSSCHYMIPVFALKFSSISSKEAIQLNPSEPLVQSPTSPFRPPIAA